MEFEYAEDFKKLIVSSPPDNYTAKNIIAYRWVFDAILNEKHFKPRWKIAPQRILDNIEEIKDSNERDQQKCDMFALSMFDAEDSARRKFEKLLGYQGPITYERFGTYIAQGEIIPEDGVNEEINNEGHFNHHPVINHHYEERFIIISKL